VTGARWDADIALDIQTDLGEGPLWDHRTNTLIFVDIHAGEIYSMPGGAGGRANVRGVGQGVGAVGLRGESGYVLGTSRGFSVLDDDGSLRDVADLGLAGGLRMNDCQVGPDGAFWGGTMPWEVGDGTPPGAVYRLAADGGARTVIRDVIISNGIGWAPDHSVMYYVDSAKRTVDAFRFDAGTGAIRDRSVFVKVDNGVPDGLCVDEEGATWVAAWGAGQVQRFSPAGELIGVVRVPAGMVTSCCFGGSGLGLLYITSGSAGIPPAERHAEHAGALFVADVGVRGRPANIFGRHVLGRGV
jgi:sugar lactone lactonase YvrE